MPRLDLNLGPLHDARQRLAVATKDQMQLDSRIAEAAKALHRAQQQGVPAIKLEEISGLLRDLQNDRRHLGHRRDDLVHGVEDLAKGLTAGLDPSAMAGSMDGGIPVALFPVRIETRFDSDRNAWRIRVYPDVLHVLQHAEALTDKEREAGTQYWEARFKNKDDEAERVARDMARFYGTSRTQWILRVLTPENMGSLGKAGAKPKLPLLPVIDDRAKTTRAVLLPDRWCFIGYAAGRREVFRSWGNRIPDELSMSPDWLNTTGEREGLFDGERSWLVNFDAAVEKGMAHEVTQDYVNAWTQQHHTTAFKLGTDLLERLIVVGLEWTKDATQTAHDVAGLLAAHRDSRGFGFVPLGTPTNNTEGAPSGYSPMEERNPPPTVKENAALPKEKEALDLIRDAFGLPADSLDADGIRNAHLPEQRTALHMMNVLWRGTFGHYLMEMWNPTGAEEDGRFLKTPTSYALRQYVVSYVRPGGPLPVMRIGSQPYGVLPVAGKGFVDAADSYIETGINKVLSFVRPMWDMAVPKVSRLTDGDINKAQDILQTGPWSQTAFYRDADPKVASYNPLIVRDPKQLLIQQLLALFGFKNYMLTSISSQRFLPNDTYPPGYLAGVPWVLADGQDPRSEAPDDSGFGSAPNYLAQMANELDKSPEDSDPLFDLYQGGPALLQALIAFSVKMERHDAVVSSLLQTSVVSRVNSLALPLQVNIEPANDTATTFEVRTPKELASVVVPSMTGRATLGQYVAQSLSLNRVTEPRVRATEAARGLWDVVAKLPSPIRNMAAAQISLNYLASRTIGELNSAFRTTLDAFSYRLDAWYTARASRRLESARGRKPAGLYLGGFGWVENLRADTRPDSGGHVLAPSLGQAATAAILRSGFLANHEQGAFNIDLSSERARLAMDLLAGLTADQPLAALYGYRIERGLRDQLLGQFIWPLRLAFPWRPAGDQPSDEPAEAVSARDVVDGVALLGAWADRAAVKARLKSVAVGEGSKPFEHLADWSAFDGVIDHVAEIADAVSDLLMAEGVYQIVQGNFERAGAAMAVADKQALPIEPQVVRTPRGGIGYTQRVAVLCPASAAAEWPQDLHSRTEPRLNAWVAHILGTPDRYMFAADVHRSDSATVHKATVGWSKLGCSPLSAVLSATSVSAPQSETGADTGFRGRLLAAFASELEHPEMAKGLDIRPEGATPTTLGLGQFEAMAMGLRQLIDKLRPLTRKDLVVPEDETEKTLDEGEYPGVDLSELQNRAQTVIDEFDSLAAEADGATTNQFLAKLAALEDFLPRSSWPQEALAIDAASPDPARVELAKARLRQIHETKTSQIKEPIKLKAGETKPTHGQEVQKALDQIKILLGRDFPVLLHFTLGPYAGEFKLSLDEQAELCAHQPWQIPGWIPKLARVREGLDRLAGVMSAHDSLVNFSADKDFKVVQLPHRKGQVWAALPEAWKAGPPSDADRVPEELRKFLSAQGSVPKDLNRTRPKLALVLHAPETETVATTGVLAGFVCDEWQESIPDPFQTAAISFQYDAPGARPPQAILLAVPPRVDQEHWAFDDLLDVVHESFDLARIRAVRPQELGGALGAILPGNYLPQDYTDDLPSVKMLGMARQALQRLQRTTVSESKVFALGKV